MFYKLIKGASNLKPNIFKFFMRKSHFLSLDIDDENNLIVVKAKYHIQIKIKYENNTSCAICTREYNELKDSDICLLECGHSFCFVCLEHYKNSTKSNFYECSFCKKESSKAYIMNFQMKIKQSLIINAKPNTEITKNDKCNRCNAEINTKYYLKCAKCNLIYHGKCLGNFTNDMINLMFFCPFCFSKEFPEEIFTCNICNEYKSKRLDNLERHKLTCNKYRCNHCRKCFRTKLSLKSHEKDVQKIEKQKMIIGVMEKEKEKNLEIGLNNLSVGSKNGKNEMIESEKHKKKDKNMNQIRNEEIIK